MVLYLLDTNILLRLVDTSATTSALVHTAVDQLLDGNDECIIVPQVLIEFWVVATRPGNVNGFGWTATEAAVAIEGLQQQFRLLEERAEIFSIWSRLATQHSILGKRSHDLRLVAAMLTHGVTHLLTLNPKDFNFPDIQVVHPQELTD